MLRRIPFSLVLLLISASVLATVHLLALEFYLYFHYVWLDIPMHILGGSVVVLAWYSLPKLGIALPRRYFQFVPSLVAVLIVGLCWEVFEIWAGIPLIELNFEKDMVSDLIFDLIGGTIGFAVAHKTNELTNYE